MIVYTLQGWIKGVNPVMGGTLKNGTDTTEAYPVAQDVYGYSLNYYNGDYKAIGIAPQGTSVLGALGANAAPLYNGNIAAMVVNLPKISGPMVYNYHYDQLNRIVAMDAFSGLNHATGTFTPVSLSSYRERVSYDPNGNIMTYYRRGDASRLAMDSLRYFYQSGNNRLHKVLDDAADVSQPQYANYNDLKQGQVDNNYGYDEIGNLTKDLSEGIQAGGISWTVYGKIASVTKNGSTVYYAYDASGNRVSKKTTTEETYYVRDASGNVMSIYKKPAAGSVQQDEIHLYGSSRIGMLTARSVQGTEYTLAGGFGNARNSKFTRAEKLFELSNHLGNVLVTVSDRKVAIQNGSTGTILRFEADVVSATDYYPFGMLMPGRKYEAQSGYRYGFNGKEKDKDINSLTTYDYGFRIYNPGIGKFLSVDPLTKDYPWYTPYQFAGNMPIWAIDQDGLEPVGYSFNATKKSAWVKVSDDQTIKNANQLMPTGIFATLTRYSIKDDNGAVFNVFELTSQSIGFGNKMKRVTQFFYESDLGNPQAIANYALKKAGDGSIELKGSIIPFETQEQIDKRTGNGVADIILGTLGAGFLAPFTPLATPVLIGSGSLTLRGTLMASDAAYQYFTSGSINPIRTITAGFGALTYTIGGFTTFDISKSEGLDIGVQKNVTPVKFLVSFGLNICGGNSASDLFTGGIKEKVLAPILNTGFGAMADGVNSAIDDQEDSESETNE